MATTPVAPLPAGAPAPSTPTHVINPQAPLGAGSTREDVLAADLASKLTARLQSTSPAPSLPVSPSLPPTPTAAAAPVAEPVVAPPPIAEPTSDLAVPDLDAIDFDRPAEIVPSPAVVPPAAPAPGLTPAELARVDEEFKAALAGGDLDKIEAAFLRTPRGRMQLQIFKTMREIGAPPEPDGKGGIGHIPTIDEIKAADAAHRNLQAIQFDIANDLPNFVKNLVTFRENGASFVGGPQQVQQMLSTIPEVLWQGAQTNPLYGQLFDAYAAPVFSRTFDHQYSQAFAMPEVTDAQKADKVRVLDALRVTEFLVTGNAREVALGQPAPAAPGRVDPETDRLRRENEALRQQQQRSQSTSAQRAVASVESTARNEGLALIGKTFEASGVSKHFNTAILDPVKESLYTSLSAKLPSLNPTGWQTYQFQLRQVANGQLAPASAAATFRSLFVGAVKTSPEIRSTLEHYVTAAKASASTRQAAIVDPQTQTAPSAPGTPVQTNVTPANQRERQAPNGGGDKVDQMATRIANSLNAARANRPQGQ